MKTMFVTCVAAGSLVLIGAAVAADGAQGARGKTAQPRDPMQASAAMPGAVAVPVRYDSACRSQYGFGSDGYNNCLQRLPATALVRSR